MTTKTKINKNDITSEQSHALYALLARLDEQSRLMAKKLHDLGYIYALYGALDGLSLSYSTLKYAFDVFLANSSISSSDAMHEWMLTPAGLAITATGSISVIVLSMLANHLNDNDKDAFKRYIVILWPYIRDVMKGLKNGYKGVKTTLQVANLLGGLELNFLLLPVGLLLGGLSVLNRLWFRHMLSQRKAMMKNNALLLAEINEYEELSYKECDYYRSKIKRQTQLIRGAALFSAFYGGVIDSLYLYMGVLSLCSIAWPALVAMTTICVLYSICCIATRIYEEYDYQRKLLITQAKIDLALYSKENSTEMQAAFTRLQEISEIIAKRGKVDDSSIENDELLREQYDLTAEIKNKISIFSEKRKHLQSLLTLSSVSAFLAGLKNGLAAYGALTSVMFAVATILVLTSTAFPPALLISCASIGLLLLMGFIAHSLIHNYRHRAKQKEEANKPFDGLWGMLQGLKDVKESPASENLAVDVKTIIGDSLVVDPSPQFFFQEWFEVIRSFFSGLGKGSKSVDYTMNPLQEMDEMGHYHDTPIMMVVSLLGSLVYGISLALRSHARSFGRPSIDQVKPSPVAPSFADSEIEMQVITQEKNLDVFDSAFKEEQECDEEFPLQGLKSISATEESGCAERRPDSSTKKFRSASLLNLTFFKPSASHLSYKSKKPVNSNKYTNDEQRMARSL